MKPFMKWAGGKRQLLNELTQRLPKQYGCYYEPFLGCGALLLHLTPEKAVVGDINARLINLWLQIRDNLSVLLREISWFEKMPCTQVRYNNMRHEYNLLKDKNSISAAATLWWINAHCFNGLYRVSANGNFNVPWNKKENTVQPDIDNLQKISTYLTRVDIGARSYQDTCATVEEGDFVYFDPPYDPISDTARFTSYTEQNFVRADQEELAAFVADLTKRNVMVMISNNDTPLIRNLYSSYKIETVVARRAINADGQNRKGSEVIITNY